MSTDNASLPTMLLVVFITLKLVGVITWSWVWVLAPFWIPAALALIAFGVFVLFFK